MQPAFDIASRIRGEDHRIPWQIPDPEPMMAVDPMFHAVPIKYVMPDIRMPIYGLYGSPQQLSEALETVADANHRLARINGGGKQPILNEIPDRVPITTREHDHIATLGDDVEILIGTVGYEPEVMPGKVFVPTLAEAIIPYAVMNKYTLS